MLGGGSVPLLTIRAGHLVLVCDEQVANALYIHIKKLSGTVEKIPELADPQFM